MAVEAQRLIAISLGKIASSRGRRTGVDLHKNLLVSSVLHRAKNAFIIETYRATVQAKTEAAKVEKQTLKSENAENSRPVEAMDTQRVQPDVTSEKDSLVCSENKENNPAVANENDKENTPMESSDKLKEKQSNCDKIRPSCEVLESKQLNNQTDYTTSCGGCVSKRRHSEVDESDSNSCKRFKSENNNNCQRSILKKSQGNDSQISSLVNIFNTGFSGLVNVANQKGQGYSESPATNSCATAVANGFDKIARPIMAMAMTV